MKNLHWIKEDKRYLLKNDDSTVVELLINSPSIATFSIGNNQYKVTRQGLFSAGYIVQSNGEEILKLSHSFWGSNGSIVFNDGTVYTCHYKNRGGLKMHFMDGGDEILSYGRTMEHKKVIPTFSIGITMVDADRLLVLLSLGMIMVQFLFREDSADEDMSLLLAIA